MNSYCSANDTEFTKCCLHKPYRYFEHGTSYAHEAKFDTASTILNLFVHNLVHLILQFVVFSFGIPAGRKYCSANDFLVGRGYPRYLDSGGTRYLQHTHWIQGTHTLGRLSTTFENG